MTSFQRLPPPVTGGTESPLRGGDVEAEALEEDGSAQDRVKVPLPRHVPRTADGHAATLLSQKDDPGGVYRW